MRFFIACAAIFTVASNLHAADLRWQHQPGVTRAGFQGAVPGDFDGDGRDEAVFTASMAYDTAVLSVLGRDGDGLALRQTLAIEGMFEAPIIVGRVGSSDRIMALVQQDDDSYALVEYGGQPLKELRRLPQSGRAWPIALADVDADGDNDILVQREVPFFGDVLLELLDHATGQVIWTEMVQTWGATTAQLDHDAALEIVISGTPGRVIDGATRMEEWSYPAGFGWLLLVGEFDGDNATQEFASTDKGDPLTRFFRSVPYAPLHEVETGLRSMFAEIDDIDGDGLDEVIDLAEYENGIVSAYTPANQTFRTFAQGDFVPSVFASADLVGTSAAEIVLIADMHLDSTDPVALKVMDTATQEVRLIMPHVFGPHSALVLADVDLDGTAEVLHALRQPELEPGFDAAFCALDAETGRRKFCHLREAQFFGPIEVAPVLGRLNGEPRMDLVLYHDHDGKLEARDGATYELIWRREIDWGPTALGMIRLDADEFDDVVVLSSPGVLYALDGRNGNTLWQSAALGGPGFGGTTLTLADVDGDSAIEILVVVGDTLHAFDAQTQTLQWSIPTGLDISRLVVWGSAAACRLGLYAPEGTFRTYRCSHQGADGPDRVFPANAGLLRALEPTTGHFVVTSAGRVLTVAPSDAVREWARGLGGKLGNNNSGAVIALESRRYDVIVGSDAGVARVGIHLDRVFADGFD